MAGLNLISTSYSSNSEDDEINEDANCKPDKTLNRLPLPESIASWKGVEHHREVIDEPLLHEGRIRSFKHERGNWATLVYLNYVPSQAMIKWMSSVLKDIPLKCNVMTDQLHISVTRSLILKFHWLESFIQEVGKLCKNKNRFRLEFSNVREYCNTEKTRTFVGIECVESSGTLNSFITDLNNILIEYGLSPFYEDSSYHVSFLWCLGDETVNLRHITPLLTRKLNNFLVDHPEDQYMYVNEVFLKTGNQLYALKLK